MTNRDTKYTKKTQRTHEIIRRGLRVNFVDVVTNKRDTKYNKKAQEHNEIIRRGLRANFVDVATKKVTRRLQNNFI